ncbi:amino acid adenylation domain-containing protein [Ectothiorhodospira sp. BSL-9]|uniref:amino acid adenylation domain-containing protein n=1 Tax=Ectothiorhodospira sp. BSL-9 TaxID=1442136 RepID=UPI0007B45953|nr:amino acid adenylation domain-containing protein [Ectothiorhodospira sp. BSL-9]ANB02217.1 thioester reductase [Ectothiorhodospira sp. BSL-9]
MNIEKTDGLHRFFLSSAASFPERPAIDVEGQVLTYAQLLHHAQRVGQSLLQTGKQADTSLVGILGSRTLPVYTGILGGLMAGFGIVPLNPAFPPARIRHMINLSGLRTIVVDAGAVKLLPEFLDCLDAALTLVLPSGEIPDEFAARWPEHNFVSVPDLGFDPSWTPPPANPDDLGYLFFTSGSTGTPKGVGMSHSNLVSFVEMSLDRYIPWGINENDRFSQFYDITFDSSLFDLFVSWSVGACLCVPSASEWINPNRYILDKSLTVIDIVPSAGHAMSRRNGWRAGRFPLLRLCRFGGEALSSDLALAMCEAAPNAEIDNAYGPTECTVDSAYYRWDREHSPSECEHGMVPIGYPGNGVSFLVVDEAFSAVSPGHDGELLIAGQHVTQGYWKDDKRTEAAFMQLPDQARRYYRTGDLVRQPEPGKPYIFLGRIDHQIKIGGVRIELGEVEQALRDVSGTDQAVALGWPLTSSGAAGLVGFICGGTFSTELMRDQLKERLPMVMVPRQILTLDALPLNVNGKVDRKALLERLEQKSEGG